MGLRNLAYWAIAASVGLVVGFGADQAHGQEKAPSLADRAADPVYMSWVAQKKVSECIKCHTQGPGDAEILAGNAQRLTAFSRRTEMELWLSSDKHTIARRRVEPYLEDDEEAELQAMLDGLVAQQTKVIKDFQIFKNTTIPLGNVLPKRVPEEWVGDSNILSRRICDKLWGQGKVTEPEGYALFRDNCLTCHGGYQTDDPGFTLASKGSEPIGIDCMYCHQEGNNVAWIKEHPSPDDWRLSAPLDKSKKGMRDLVRTSRQADLCFDCHVGNRRKNMFVTHEMYAAGHPPIPSIELQQFCETMPQHWQTPWQLYDGLEGQPGRDQYFAINYPGVVGKMNAGQVYWNTRKMLIGALTARRKTIDLYADSAASGDWADYSLYDCAACHHELKTDSLRQQRGFPGAPGRPRQHEWPDALLSILYEETTLAQSGQLEQQLKQQFSAQPFGDPEVVGPTASQLREGIDSAIKNLESKPVNAAVAMKLLMKLAETDKSQLVTYDSARQVVWAMNTIVEEMVREGAPINPSIVAKVKSLRDPEVSGVAAKLPSGRKQFIYPEELATDLSLAAKFDPKDLSDRLREISRLPAKAVSANTRR